MLGIIKNLERRKGCFPEYIMNDTQITMRLHSLWIEGMNDPMRVEIANYKKLCELLGWDYTGGKKRELRMEDLKRFCKYHKEGHKIIIDTIYDIPKAKVDNRKDGNHKVYVTLVESVLLSYFIEHELTTANFRKKELWEILGLVNTEYGKYDDNYAPLKRELQMYNRGIKDWQISNFYADSRRVMNNIVNSALKSLRNRKLIEFEDNVLVAKDKRGSYFEVKDKALRTQIFEIEKETLNELNCASLSNVIYNSNKEVTVARYMKLRDDKLKSRLGIQYIFRRYHIICNPKYLNQGLVENLETLKQELNDKSMNKVLDTIKQRCEQTNRDPEASFRYHGSYMDIQKMLAMKLLSTDKAKIEEFFLLRTGWEADELELFA